ncbi:phage head closure protein [Caloranaerobacter ferrireducens]|uniref:phage head closure protein n=1 Tax=Caloranaerobacter ferrireducens TaxID=1323370 RepID=UPI00084D19B4|nr:phage head closure protein [Caloranaerobacter ferrireducens]
MNVGLLRDRVTIQNYVRIPDGYGGYTETWQDVATVWANIKPLRGREFFQAQQIQSEVTHKITIRYTDAVNITSRIKYKNKTFEIKSIIDIDNRHRFLEIMCIGSD